MQNVSDSDFAMTREQWLFARRHVVFYQQRHIDLFFLHVTSSSDMSLFLY